MIMSHQRIICENRKVECLPYSIHWSQEVLVIKMKELELLQRILCDNGIYPISGLEDESLPCDSFTFLSIVIDIENTLNIRVDERMLKKCPNTYREWCEFVCKLTQ